LNELNGKMNFDIEMIKSQKIPIWNCYKWKPKWTIWTILL